MMKQLSIKTILLIVILVVPFLPICSEDEVNFDGFYKWRKTNGEFFVQGRFWFAQEGKIFIKEKDSGQILSINAIEVYPADLHYLFQTYPSILSETCELIKNTFFRTTTGKIIARSPEYRQLTVTWERPIETGIWLISIHNLPFVAKVDSSFYKVTPSQTDTLYARPTGDLIILPSGKETKLIELGYIMESKELFSAIRQDPILFAPYLTGTSERYRIWLETQKKLQKAEERTEKIQALQQESEERRKEKQELRLLRESIQAKENVITKLKTDLERYTNKLHLLEAQVQEWELAKKRHKIYSEEWNQYRKKISQAKEEIEVLEKTIKKITIELKESEEELKQLKIKLKTS